MEKKQKAQTFLKNRKSYIQGAASDDGTAIGAAFYVWNALLKKARAGLIDHASLGPEYSEAEMDKVLVNADLSYERLDRDKLLTSTADRLTAGQVIGWYQGRSEWGPRALGNRSILAHPGWPGMKDLINKKIKRREAFRPFAPTILAGEVPNYFEQTLESPFMMHVVKITPDKRDIISAVCHEDFTGRMHTVKRSQNTLYYDLIKAFSERTGVPVLLNTSFNENEPIVDTPAQAVNCFQRNDIDVLVLGPFLCEKLKTEIAMGFWFLEGKGESRSAIISALQHSAVAADLSRRTVWPARDVKFRRLTTGGYVGSAS